MFFPATESSVPEFHLTNAAGLKSNLVGLVSLSTGRQKEKDREARSLADDTRSILAVTQPDLTWSLLAWSCDPFSCIFLGAAWCNPTPPHQPPRVSYPVDSCYPAVPLSNNWCLITPEEKWQHLGTPVACSVSFGQFAGHLPIRPLLLGNMLASCDQPQNSNPTSPKLEPVLLGSPDLPSPY